ncbi:hypothetical protein SDC9_88865 [bioreactor metagenome]|uniref:HTH cro/C1-type domain-containing protein n=1 Tax=bioreactor metagenome TaxID=1076179 RepID=A0A644ZMZ3_9ZZZZ
MENNFRVILAEKRKSIANVHEGTGISKTTLTNLYYERTKNPDSATIVKIAKYLGTTLDELLIVKE